MTFVTQTTSHTEQMPSPASHWLNALSLRTLIHPQWSECPCIKTSLWLLAVQKKAEGQRETLGWGTESAFCLQDIPSSKRKNWHSSQCHQEAQGGEETQPGVQDLIQTPLTTRASTDSEWHLNTQKEREDLGKLKELTSRWETAAQNRTKPQDTPSQALLTTVMDILLTFLPFCCWHITNSIGSPDTQWRKLPIYRTLWNLHTTTYSLLLARGLSEPTGTQD